MGMEMESNKDKDYPVEEEEDSEEEDRKPEPAPQKRTTRVTEPKQKLPIKKEEAILASSYHLSRRDLQPQRLQAKDRRRRQAKSG
jgi:hypothetical protein